MDLVLFGIQGSGKGTQAKRIAAEYGYEIFEAGSALRAIADSGSELGETVRSFIDVGKLVPHAIIIATVKEAVAKRPREQKILFDGIPRDLDQQRDFDALMVEQSRSFRCLHLRLDPEVGIQRILKRAAIEGRADDGSEETIRKRMALFRDLTLPVIERYAAQGKVVEVEGTGTVEEIYGHIIEALFRCQYGENPVS